MTAEMRAVSEEAFVSRYIEMDASDAENLEAMDKLIHEYRIKAEKIADAVEDGLYFDRTDAVFVIQVLAYAKKYKEIIGDRMKKITSQ